VKLTATTRTNLHSTAVRHRLTQTVSRGVAGRLALELEEELRLVRASGRAEDPDAGREALARAVRRHFGAPL
jgi:hypothetical protein